MAEVPGLQLLPVQHPVVQLAEQLVLMQLPSEQVSVAAHATQSAPGLPQLSFIDARQAPVESQQPAQVSIQGPLQVPSTPQVCVPEHVEQRPPPVPQCSSVESTHLSLSSQHPVGQVAAEHVAGATQCLSSHFCPPVQATHAFPPEPHCVSVIPSWHFIAESVQPMHAVLRHTPFLHAVPVPHFEHVPPAAPHCASVLPVAHALLVASTQPLHAVVLQIPSVQVSFERHFWQRLPVTPQALSPVASTQVVPSQQPLQVLSHVGVVADDAQPDATPSANSSATAVKTCAIEIRRFIDWPTGRGE